MRPADELAVNDASPSTTFLVQQSLDRLKAGDPAAHDALIAVAAERLRRLTRKMMADFDRLRRWEDADDIAQAATLRLYQSLKETIPDNPLSFFRLGALQIRRELLDLARHYYGPRGTGANHASGLPSGSQSPADPGQSTYDPGHLAEWTEFHERIESLAEDERALIDLLWYQGLSQEDCAELLGVDVRTVQRRWVKVRLKLHDALRGDPA